MEDSDPDLEATVLPFKLRPKRVAIQKGQSETFTPSQFPVKVILADVAYLEIVEVPEEQWGSPYILVDPVRFSGDPSVDIFFPVTEIGELVVGRVQTPSLFSVPRVAQNVSRLHFGVRRQGRMFTIRDCNSKNGTTVAYQ